MKMRWLSSLFHRRTSAGAMWFARLKAKPVTAQLDAKYRRWLAADPANEVRYERHELAWALAGELAKDDEIAELLADAERPLRPVSNRASPSRRVLLTWSAAAATVAAVAIGTTFYLLPSPGEQYATAIGEQRSVLLPDQSRMILNTSTSVRVTYRRNVRSIELEHGEVTFSVAHDAARPFEVTAGSGMTRALGTEFNVLAADGRATVAVLSGKVEVITRDAQGGSAAMKLLAGQEVSYTPGVLSVAHAVNADRIQAWHSGRISFSDVPLEQAVSELNRYTQVPVVVSDPSLKGLRVTGLFRIGETDALLSALDTAFGIQAKRRGATIELYRPDGEAPPPAAELH